MQCVKQTKLFKPRLMVANGRNICYVFALFLTPPPTVGVSDTPPTVVVKLKRHFTEVQGS